MTSTDGRVHGHIVTAASGTIRLRLPFAGPLIVKLMSVYIVLLFVVSANVLDLIGYDYSAIEGSPLTKIHVATYVLVLVSLVFVVSYPNTKDLFRYYLATKLGTIYFIFAATFALINIVADRRNGFGMYFDTDLHLFLCCMLLPFVPPASMDKLERFLHAFFAVNAFLAVIELVTGGNIFPLTTYSPDGLVTLEPRATALLSHPLHAATLTSVYIVSLLIGAGGSLRSQWRVPMIALQVVALLAFGGRTALLLTLALMTVVLAWQALRFTAGRTVSRNGVVATAAIVPVGIAVVSALAYLGFFDQFLDRFTEDGGSARSRVLMLPLLQSFNWTDLLWGASTDFVRAQIYSFGLEWGVENPFFQMSVYQGVVVAFVILTGLLLVLYEAWRRLLPQAIFPIAIYLLLCNTFGSFAGRFINLSIFMIVVSTLFRRRDASTRFVT